MIELISSAEKEKTLNQIKALIRQSYTFTADIRLICAASKFLDEIQLKEFIESAINLKSPLVEGYFNTFKFIIQDYYSRCLDDEKFDFRGISEPSQEELDNLQKKIYDPNY